MPFPAPGVTPPALADFEFNFNDYTFGGVDVSHPVTLVKADGLDIAPIRGGDPSAPRDHGAFSGLNLLDARTITLDLLLGSNSPGFRFSTAKAALMAALAPGTDTEQPLYIKMPDLSPLACMARVTRAAFTIDTTRIAPASGGQQGGAPVSVQFKAVDPRFYDTPTQSTSFVTGTSATLTHVGDMEMRPVLVITGGCTNPSISNTSLPGSPTLTFTGVVAASDTLTIDLDFPHSVTYFNHTTGATSVAANWITTASTWWNLVPGANTIHFSSAGGGFCAVHWASAYGTAA